MANRLEDGFTPIDALQQITREPEAPLPLFGEVFNGKAVDINFIETGYEYDGIPVENTTNKLDQ